MKDIVLASLPAAIPTLTVLTALPINQVLIGRLASENTRLDFNIDGMRARSDSKMDALSKQITDGIVMLMGRDIDKGDRLARLEEKTKS